MAQVKECIQKAYECSKVRDTVVPKSCLRKQSKHNCRCKSITACKALKNEYKYVQPCRPDLCIPAPQTHLSDARFADDSIYSRSFYQHDVCRAKPVIHPDHIVMAGEFQDETVHKLSYPVQCAPVVQKITPKDHCLTGTGPMRLITTQQHDYYGPCDAGRRKNIIPISNLIRSECPMAGLTTTNLSYQPVCAGPMENYKPHTCYTVPVEGMDMNTVQRCSYKLVEPNEKLPTPWAEKLEYCKPDDAIECCTVYNYSYKEPGAYMLDDGCGNTLDIVAESTLENCCPPSCLADNVDDEFKSRFIKAHQFDD
ncbi:uncharacterized protein LOC132933651 [Metopolophium dirhodum]|uniref:uncharacterized protein LOC132933651 n=1 Tax=Metopolophium dirhodum TaxID=44670 RepID=UPI0029907395|nr:uncharacterized protein LOC132933651 [Metopolophium dirhodum]